MPGSITVDHMRRQAFTLIELLVVISIIGLLSTVAVVATSSSRVKARNAKRTADMHQLITAFNLAYAVNGVYPDSTASSGGWACMSGAACLYSWSSFTASASVDSIMIPSFLGAKPSDPNDSSRTIGGYMYGSAWVGGGAYSPGPTMLFWFSRDRCRVHLAASGYKTARIRNV